MAKNIQGLTEAQTRVLRELATSERNGMHMVETYKPRFALLAGGYIKPIRSNVFVITEEGRKALATLNESEAT